MIRFLQFIFTGIPATKSYEAKLQDEETKYTVYLETIESDDFRRYNELKEYFANPANLKVGTDMPQKERQLEKEYRADFKALNDKGLSLDKEFQAKKALQPQKEQQLKKTLKQKIQAAKSKDEYRQLEKTQKQEIQTNAAKLKDERRQLKETLKQEMQAAKSKDERRLLKEAQKQAMQAQAAKAKGEIRLMKETLKHKLQAQAAKAKEELRLLEEEKLRLQKQIAMDRRHLKEEGVNLRKELETEQQKLKENFHLAKKRLKEDLQQQKDELQQLKHELKRLNNSKMIKDYFIFKKKYAKLIEEQERWVSKFYEDFSKNEIDQRWSKTQVISEQLLNGAPYSPIEDLHIFSPNNIQSAGGLLKIKTKQEKKEGLAWDKTYGFVPKTFSYTSGILTSAHSFKQLYGKFEAKVRVKYAPGIYHAFWMGTDTQKPHLNVFRFEGRNLVISAYSNEAKIEKKLKYKLKDDFYIYTLLWSNNKLTWLINGKKVFESSNIINEPMYISFSSGVYDKKAEQTAMYVDWVRCFRSNG
ncbi:MAG: family 16 glycosylhydrolase [Prevotellaceae bacterium]|jgi:hypothetical protein|nr:family 16 glycosylhydrolase [Prevotellaceae bacterium]